MTTAAEEDVESGELRGRLELLCGPVADAQLVSLLRFRDALRRRGRAAGLMSKRAMDAVEEHIVDAASVLSVCRFDRDRVADVGSGGGFPGVVLSVLEPTADVTLIEAAERKVAFLKGVVRELGLRRTRVLHGRAEESGGERAYDAVLAKALGSIEVALPVCLRLVAVSGRVILYKGPGWGGQEPAARELARQAGAELGWVREVELPGLGRRNVFVEFHVKQQGPSEANQTNQAAS